MFYLPTLCGLEYHMSLGAIDSNDLCVNTVLDNYMSHIILTFLGLCYHVAHV